MGPYFLFKYFLNSKKNAPPRNISSNTQKNQKGMVTYHHTTSMKKHITFECANVWERWKKHEIFKLLQK
jgi:hypothetical protein